MDRQIITRYIALVVAIFALGRWLPGGGPWQGLALDSKLAELRETDPDAPQAYMRGLRRIDSDAFYHYWLRQLRKMRLIRDEADDDTLVQFKGVPRNEQWLLMFDLYPIKMCGAYYEDGGSEDEPDLPGATPVLSYLLRSGDDLAPHERKRLNQAIRERDRMERDGLELEQR